MIKHFLADINVDNNSNNENKSEGMNVYMRSMYIYDPFDVRNISPLNSFYYLLGVLNYKNIPLIPLVPNQPPDLRIPEIKN